MMIWSRCLALLACLLGAGSAAAQTYPSRPITIVVPATPGGVTDVLGRLLARHLSDAWGQQVIVENKPGANNQLAADYTAKSAPDGYTLFIAPEVTFVANPSLYPKLAYDPVKDFSPITGLVIINHALIVNPAVPATSVKELIDLGRQRPGELNYGTYGLGSTGHLNMALLETLAGVKFVPVHYKGAAPALTDVVAGHIQMMFVSLGTAMGQWKEGKVRLLAIGASKRLAALPDVPTVAEGGLPGYEAVSWFGLFGPAGMPPDVVAKLNTEVRRILADPDVRRTIIAPQFFEPIAGSPEQLAGYLKSEAAKWSKVIRDGKIKAE